MCSSVAIDLGQSGPVQPDPNSYLSSAQAPLPINLIKTSQDDQFYFLVVWTLGMFTSMVEHDK